MIAPGWRVGGTTAKKLSFGLSCVIEILIPCPVIIRDYMFIHSIWPSIINLKSPLDDLLLLYVRLLQDFSIWQLTLD